jgi:GTPase SAR1 family protein
MQPVRARLNRAQDVGGQEKFGGKTRFYYEHAVAGIVVADATKPKTIKVLLSRPVQQLS